MNLLWVATLFRVCMSNLSMVFSALFLLYSTASLEIYVALYAYVTMLIGMLTSLQHFWAQ